MTPVIVLAAIALAPVLLLMLLRINAPLVFLSLCLGDVLVQFVGKDVDALVGTFSAQAPGETPDYATVKLILLLLPPVLTMLFMLKTVKKKALWINFLPALGVGALMALLVVPLLPSGISYDITSSDIWDQAQSYQGYIVGLTATVSLITIWMQRPKNHEDKHGKH